MHLIEGGLPESRPHSPRGRHALPVHTEGGHPSLSVDPFAVCTPSSRSPRFSISRKAPDLHARGARLTSDERTARLTRAPRLFTLRPRNRPRVQRHGERRDARQPLFLEHLKMAAAAAADVSILTASRERAARGRKTRRKHISGRRRAESSDS